MSVLILMATYNGEPYIKEQLESLLNQDIGTIDILIRDDCSSDETTRILKDYSNRHSSIVWFEGEVNLKPAKSFFKLLEKASSEYDFYFFCDQDDVWDSDKVRKAISKFKEKEIPSMYYCATELVDDNLNHIGVNYRDNRFSKSLIYSFTRGSLISGCTICMNNSLVKLLKKYTPYKISMHDSWVHLLCLSVGGIIYSDSEPHIKYRQHSNNVLGLHKMSYFERIRSNFRKNTICREMAEQIWQNYSDSLSNEALRFLHIFINYKNSYNSKVSLVYYLMRSKMSLSSRLYVSTKVLLGMY